ncbi:MAG: enolase C-terminal domain-like protein [Egibacteraceae bacterium]
MSEPLIDQVSVLDRSDLAGPGDDPHVIVVHAGGTTGWYGPVGHSVRTVIQHGLASLALGSPVTDHDGLVARLREGLRQSTEAAVSWAIGALDCAVWDLHGRIADQPVAALLSSSAVPRPVRAYASWLGLDVADSSEVNRMRRVAEQDWLFTKWSLRRDPRLDTDDDAERMAGIVRRIRKDLGSPAAFDALWGWDDALTSSFAERVDPTWMVWLEEPLEAYELERYEALGSCPPLALGERLRIGGDPRPLLRHPHLVALTLDVVGCGGLTLAVELLREATTAGVQVFPHGRSLVPAVHLAAAFPGSVTGVEYQVQWEPRRRRLFATHVTCDNGRLRVPDSSGLGIVARRR